MKQGAMVGWAGLKRRSKQAALKAQTEKLRNIDLRKALHTLGKKAFEQGVIETELAEHFQVIQELDSRISEMREKAVADSEETKMAALKRVSKDTAKASQAKALTLKREHLITELGREVNAQKDLLRTQELNEESAVIADIENQILEKEEEIRGLDDGGKSGKQTLAVAAFGILLVGGVIFILLSHFRKIPEDITSSESVEYVLKNATDQNELQIRTIEQEELYFSKGSKSPHTGWIKGTKFTVSEVYDGNSKYGIDEVNLLHVTNGRIDKEWNFYAGNTACAEYEIIYNPNSGIEKHGVEGVKSIRRWKPNWDPCDETNVENGEGKSVEYDIGVYYRMGGGNSANDVSPPPTKIIHYADGKIVSIEKLETELSRQYAASDKQYKERKEEEKENKGRTTKEISLREKMQRAYPKISIDASNRIADEIFGLVANDSEATQRIRMLEELLTAAEDASLNKEQVLEKFKYWRKKCASELFNGSSNFSTSRTVFPHMKGAIRASATNAESVEELKDLGVFKSGEKADDAFVVMDNIFSNYLEFCKRFEGIVALRGLISLGKVPQDKLDSANELLTRFENIKAIDVNDKAKTEADDIELEVRNFIMSNVTNR